MWQSKRFDAGRMDRVTDWLNELSAISFTVVESGQWWYVGAYAAVIEQSPTETIGGFLKRNDLLVEQESAPGQARPTKKPGFEWL